MPTLVKLAKVLYSYGENEQNIEQKRQHLCKVSTFEPYAAFQRLDRGSKGFICPKDLLKFMR